MKATSLFRLGGIAVLLPALMYGINSLTHFLSGQEPTALVWLGWILLMDKSVVSREPIPAT